MSGAQNTSLDVGLETSRIGFVWPSCTCSSGLQSLFSRWAAASIGTGVVGAGAVIGIGICVAIVMGIRIGLGLVLGLYCDWASHYLYCNISIEHHVIALDIMTLHWTSCLLFYLLIILHININQLLIVLTCLILLALRIPLAKCNVLYALLAMV